VEECTRENGCSSNQTAGKEVDWTCSEGGFLCHKETSCKLEPPRTTWKRRPRKSCRNMIEKDAAMERKTRREIKAIPGNSAGIALWRPCAVKCSIGN